MTTVHLVKSVWSGTAGGDGLSVHCLLGPSSSGMDQTHTQAAVNRIRTFWSALVSIIPDEVQIEVQPEVDQFEVSSGVLTGTVVATTAPTVVTGTHSSTYAAGTGCRIDWNTGGILRGRRVTGRTYIVPAGGCFDATGGIASANQTAIQTACATMIAGHVTDGNQLVVWSRPNPDKGYTGVTLGVNTGTVPNKTAVLRGRRD